MAVAVASAASRVTNGAWWTLASCMFLVVIPGSNYAFGAWSGLFKDPATYGWDQQRLEQLAVLSHLGNFFVVDSGIMVSRLGTSSTMAIACAYAGFGYLGLWLAVTVFPGQCPFALAGFLCFLFGHGCGSVDNAVVTQAVADFPANRGNVIGCLKAWLGLAPATVGVIYQAVLRPNKASFLLFLGLYSIVCGLALVPVVHKTKGLVEEPEERVGCKFTLLVAAIVSMALIFFAVQVRKEQLDDDPGAWKLIMAIVIAALAAMFLLPISGSDTGKVRRADVLSREVDAAPARNLSGWEMLQSLDFYLLIVVLVIGQGNGLMFISNAPQVLEAFSGTSGSATSFVAMISVFNAVGRLTFGNASEWLRGKVHRTWFLVVALAIIIASYAALVSVGTATLAWISAACIGFGYGGLWGVQPPLMSELFGQRDYGVKYACSAFAAFLGSAIFNNAVAGPMYERAAEELGQAPRCLERGCFSTAFAVAVAADIPAILLAAWLCARCRWIYEHAQRDRWEEEGIALAKAEHMTTQ